jgi:hypothetical protein
MEQRESRREGVHELIKEEGVGDLGLPARLSRTMGHGEI